MREVTPHPLASGHLALQTKLLLLGLSIGRIDALWNQIPALWQGVIPYEQSLVIVKLLYNVSKNTHKPSMTSHRLQLIWEGGGKFPL